MTSELLPFVLCFVALAIPVGAYIYFRWQKKQHAPQVVKSDPLQEALRAFTEAQQELAAALADASSESNESLKQEESYERRADTYPFA